MGRLRAPLIVGFLVLLRAAASPLPDATLTTTRAVHGLSPEAAARAYPVRVQAVVTYYDPWIDPRRPALFVSDATGSVFVWLAGMPPFHLRPGDLIELNGESGPGDFAPVINRAQARFLRKSRLPAVAPKVTLTELLTGAHSTQWVQIEGIVRSFVESGKNIILNLALSDGDITATTLREEGVDYSRLVDARIELRGNASTLFNRQHQMTGMHLLFPGMSTVKVREPATPRPFDSPATPLARLLRFTPHASFRHRVHIQGTVTLNWPGRVVCVQEGTRGICAETAQRDSAPVGITTDLLGFPASGEFAPTLTNAVYRTVGRPAKTAAPHISAAAALSGDYDSRLVEIDGRLIGRDAGAKDPTVVLSVGDYVFSAVFPGGLPGATPRSTAIEWPEGSLLRLTGICSVQSDAMEKMLRQNFTTPKSFRIMLRSPGDVAVISRPSWWTAAHALRVLALALAGILMTAIALFRQVRKSRRTATELRREMRERLRAENATRAALAQMEHQAHHDPLTGLANRLMFDKSIQSALVAADAAGSRVGLLCLDLDHFKIVNDTLGHAAGDIVLRQAAARLSCVAPPGSLLARLGGDEFAFLLPLLAARTDAEKVALRVVEALAAPFSVEGLTWYCPASVGVSLYPDDASSVLALQKNADSALYQAKRASRGQVVMFDFAANQDSLGKSKNDAAVSREPNGLALA